MMDADKCLATGVSFLLIVVFTRLCVLVLW